MGSKLTASCFMAGALMLPIAGYAADPRSEASSSETFVRNSVITTRIKSELAEEKLSSLVRIKVDTDKKGVVTLGGTAANQGAVDKAASIARAVQGVTAVVNTIQVAVDK